MNKENREIKETREILYKYRSIENWQWFVDILLNNRLYAANYKDLNDPMEGVYYYRSGTLDVTVRDKLRDEKANLKICSLSEIDPLSKTDENFLMWSHYANGHRGVAIGVSSKIDKNKCRLRDIDYDAPLNVLSNNPGVMAEDILSHKAKFWEYEKEWRVFTEQKFVKVEIKEIIIGSKMNRENRKSVEKLVKKINPKIVVK